MSGNDSTIKYEFLDSSKNFTMPEKQERHIRLSCMNYSFLMLLRMEISMVSKLPLKPTLTPGSSSVICLITSQEKSIIGLSLL